MSGGSAARKRIEHDEEDERSTTVKMAKTTPPDNRRMQRLQALCDRAYIKRIRMHNFLAYDEVTVEPGPRLNLVVGPNGAGKSTIVSAICMALAGGLKVMDRGSSAVDYIMTGEEESIIEVDLNSPKSREGLTTIKRQITRSTSKSLFWINGQPKKEKEVKEFVLNQDIQLDNLCHFLPQEKVEAFAEMAGRPTEMLLKVEEAVGVEGMRSDHEKLIEMQTSVVKKTKDLDDKLTRRDVFMTRKQEIEVQMQRQEELEEQKKLASFVERVIPHRRWKEAKIKRNRHKQHFAPLQAELAEAQEKVSDFRSKESAAKHNIETSAEQKKRSDKESNDIQGNINKRQEHIEKMEGHFSDLKHQIKEHRSKMTAKEEKKTKLEAEVEKLKEQKAQRGKEPPDLDRRIKEANANLSELSKQVTERYAAVDRKKKEIRSIETAKVQKQKEIREFRSIDRVKMEALMRENRRTFDAWNWIRDNADRFEKPILGPLCLELSVADKESAIFVETALGFQKFVFVAQTDNDYRNIQRIASQNGHTLKQERFIKWSRTDTSLADFGGVSEAKLREYGIVDVLINRVEAPAVIKSWLCNEHYWNKLVLGTSAASGKLHAIVNDPALISISQGGKKMHRFQRVMTPEQTCVIAFSVYGNQHMSVESKPVRSSPSVIIHGDDSRLEGIKQEFQRFEAQEAEVRRTLEDLERADQALRTEQAQAQQKKNELLQEKAGYDTKIADTQIQKKGREISDLAKDMERLENMLPKIKKEYEKAHVKRVQEAEKLKVLCDKQTELALKLAIAEVEMAPLRAEHKKWKDKLVEANEVLDQKKEAVKKEEKKLAVLEKDLAEWNTTRARSALTDEEKRKCIPGPEQFRVTNRPWREGGDNETTFELSDNWETADEWQERLKELEDKIDEMGIVSDYGDELVEINVELETLNAEIPLLQDETKNHSQVVEKRKKKWLDGTEDKPGLRSMVNDINKYFGETFAKLGNVGTVELHEAKDEKGCDDFKNYGLNILVKFREKQDLQALRSGVQSGGEKSLSTMLFLLSLQQLTKCPFRVVDEINQGLDQHYERAIFERIVEWSSKDDTSQCFLITPKLQGGLLDNVGKNICVINIFKGRDMVKKGPQGRF